METDTHKTFKVASIRMPDLQAALAACFPGSDAPVLQKLSTDSDGSYILKVVGFGLNRILAEGICELAQSFRHKIVISPSNPGSQPVGTINSRLNFTGLLYHIGAHRDTLYGMQYYHRFQDSDGNEILWITGKPALINHRYKVSCRVKGHNQWGDIWQTVVTHCKLEDDYEKED